jgi:hypothetical protein
MFGVKFEVAAELTKLISLYGESVVRKEVIEYFEIKEEGERDSYIEHGKDTTICVT